MSVYVIFARYHNFENDESFLGLVADKHKAAEFLERFEGQKNVEFEPTGEIMDEHLSKGGDYRLIQCDVYDPKPRVKVEKLPESYRRGCHVVDAQLNRCDFFPIDSVAERNAHLAE